MTKYNVKPPLKTIRRKNRPDNIETKEDLIYYLKTHDNEPDFVEECWVAAVEAARNNEEKGGYSYKTVIKKDKDGNEVHEEKATKLITDPVKQYFKMCGLPKYRRQAQKNMVLGQPKDEWINKINETYFADDSENLNDEIVAWIEMIKRTEEQSYIRSRYANYMNNYEINDGADKTSLKGILSMELALYRIDVLRANGKDTSLAEEEKLRKAVRETFDAMKWNKKQRNLREEMAQNKFTVWMDNMVKEGTFKSNPKEYPKDEIDFLIETSVEAQRKMLE